jgi:hypothetical protein
MSTGLLPKNKGLATMVLDAISQLRVSPLGFGDLTTDAWG